MPPQLEASSYWCPQLQEIWTKDCCVKAKYIAGLMLDSTHPVTGMLNAAMARGGETVELGPEITQLAQRLRDL